MKPVIRKKIKDNQVCYVIQWSNLRKADKYEIVRLVPSVAGIFELYYQDDKKKLNLFFFARAWYGGLRNTLRKRTDPELEQDPARKKILDQYDCYYRYSLTESFSDMSDILYFFAKTYFPHKADIVHSGRYQDIFIDEISNDKIVTI